MPRPKQKKASPLSSAISSWLSSFSSPLGFSESELILLAPKRWVVYPPMLLLPSGSFTAGPWPSFLASLSGEQTAGLWTAILAEISTKKIPLTHLAVNEGIPLLLSPDHSEPSKDPDPGGPGSPRKQDTADGKEKGENTLRSPTGLRILHGDFGPPDVLAPSRSDFESALWVSTRQNGLAQVWAPRWTMFSRGNVKEKTRLLDFHRDPPAGLEHRSQFHERDPPGDDGIQGKWAVDLYAGIGYFVFSYARLGLRVLAWELNPWSVEGLVRGASANGFSMRVVTPSDPIPDIGVGDEQIIVFLDDNTRAGQRIREWRGAGMKLDVVHVNCGFLPSSIKTWHPAWEIQTGGGGKKGWLHLHENVGLADIEHRKGEIQTMFDEWGKVSVEHVELVKTFAPDVWHCVFDVYTGF